MLRPFGGLGFYKVVQVRPSPVALRQGFRVAIVTSVAKSPPAWDVTLKWLAGGLR